MAELNQIKLKIPFLTLFSHFRSFARFPAIGSILFIFYINDANSCFKTTSFFLIYAEEVKMFSLISGIADAFALQGDLAAFAA